MMPSINNNTKATIKEKEDFVKMEAYDVHMSIQTTMKDADDAVKIQDNPAYDIATHNKP